MLLNESLRPPQLKFFCNLIENCQDICGLKAVSIWINFVYKQLVYVPCVITITAFIVVTTLFLGIFAKYVFEFSEGIVGKSKFP